MQPSIELPFPSAKLSGHNSGSWYNKSDEVAAMRIVARQRVRRAGWVAPKYGDIFLRFTFIPPDRRGDRTNYYNRLKSAIDGIADALKVNDKRFVPIIEKGAFHEPKKPGCVIVELVE